MHSCPSCSKSFKFQSGLARHMVIHKPHSRMHCSCGSIFTRSDNLKRHQIKCTGINTNLGTSNDESVDVTTLNSNNDIKPETAKLLDVIVTPTEAEPISNINTCI